MRMPAAPSHERTEVPAVSSPGPGRSRALVNVESASASSDVLVLRSYTDRELRRTIRAAGGWEVAATYDFTYDIAEPIEVDGTCEDVVYVLRRS